MCTHNSLGGMAKPYITTINIHVLVLHSKPFKLRAREPKEHIRDLVLGE